MSEWLTINEDIAIPLDAIELTAIRSRGAGGQNVNKVASAIQLRFDVKHCEALPAPARERLLALGDRRVTAAGEIVIKAQEFRHREQNRQAALDRLAELLRASLEEPAPRKPTRPPAGEKKKRVEEKRRRGAVKRLRQDPTGD